MSLRVRPAAVRDVEAITALEHAALGRDAWPEPLVRDGVAGGLPTVHYLVADEEAALVGYAVASAAGDIAELQRIAVTARHRRTGVATALLAAVDELLLDTEAERLLLEVREDNEAALGFYARSGFVEIDRRPRYYRDGATAVVLQRTVPR